MNDKHAFLISAVEEYVYTHVCESVKCFHLKATQKAT